MSNEILEPKLTSIGTLLRSNRQFVVPHYQRSFDWEVDDAESFWEDIIYAIDHKSDDYFLGTIVLNTEDQNNHKIIDGQQRLTCISMIFSAVCKELKARNDDRAGRIFDNFLASRGFERNAVPSPKLRLNKINNEAYIKFVIEDTPQNTIRNTLKTKLHKSNRKLLKIYDFFLSRVNQGASKQGIDYDDFLSPLIDCLDRTLKLIQIPVTSEEGAYLIFESVNARGKELAVSDLIKNRLFYESESGNQIDRAQHLWEQMEFQLSENPIPEFIRHFWIARKAPETNVNIREKKLYREVLLSLPEKSKARANKTVELLDDLSESALLYSSLTDYSLWPDDPEYDLDLEQILKELKMFRVKQCYPALLNIRRSFNSSRDIVKAFQTIVNFSFRYTVIGKNPSGTLELTFGKLAYEIRKGHITTYKDITDYLLDVNSNVSFRGTFEKATISKRQNKLGRFILAKVENFREQQINGASFSPIDFESKAVSLEHILPQSERENRSWSTYFDSGANVSEYVYRLGNLTLMTRKRNAKIDNSSFDKKKKIIEGSSFHIDEYIKNASRWGNKEIEQRQGQLSKIAVQVWQL